MTNGMTILDWTQFAVLIVVAAFFGIRFVQGWFNPNMSLSGETERRAGEDNCDDLAISITITKGGIGSITLKGAVVRATWLDGGVATELSGLTRLPIKKSTKSADEIPWDGKKPLNLSPGTSSTWSCHVKVPDEHVCTIQVVIYGRQKLDFGFSQWRASL